MLSLSGQADKPIPFQISSLEGSLLGQFGHLPCAYSAPVLLAFLLFWNTATSRQLTCVLFAENTLLPDLYGAPFLTSVGILLNVHPLGDGVSSLPLQRHHSSTLFRVLITVRSDSLYLFCYWCALCVTSDNINSMRTRNFFHAVSLVCGTVLGTHFLSRKYLLNE